MDPGRSSNTPRTTNRRKDAIGKQHAEDESATFSEGTDLRRPVWPQTNRKSSGCASFLTRHASNRAPLGSARRTCT
jgi:hypothetical protein